MVRLCDAIQITIRTVQVDIVAVSLLTVTLCALGSPGTLFSFLEDLGTIASQRLS